MIVVTGGAGFIGSNVIKGLNSKGIEDILVVEDLRDGTRFVNLVDLRICDYEDKDDFIANLNSLDLTPGVKAVFHQGGCTDTTEWNGRLMMKENYEYSKTLLEFCQKRKIPFIYASSAAVYGSNDTFVESAEFERPLNIYGYSKLLFDQYVRRKLTKGPSQSQIVGLRYFNPYGPGEQHKGPAASIILKFYKELKESGQMTVFGPYGKYQAGEYARDFIYVDDIVRVILWFFDHPSVSGIYNCGTGRAQSYNKVCQALTDSLGMGGAIKYVDFPENLRNRFQCETQADLSNLRKVGCDVTFCSIDDGIKSYIRQVPRKIKSGAQSELGIVGRDQQIACATVGGDDAERKIFWMLRVAARRQLAVRPARGYSKQPKDFAKRH